MFRYKWNWLFIFCGMICIEILISASTACVQAVTFASDIARMEAVIGDIIEAARNSETQKAFDYYRNIKVEAGRSDYLRKHFKDYDDVIMSLDAYDLYFKGHRNKALMQILKYMRKNNVSLPAHQLIHALVSQFKIDINAGNRGGELQDVELFFLLKRELMYSERKWELHRLVIFYCVMTVVIVVCVLFDNFKKNNR